MLDIDMHLNSENAKMTTRSHFYVPGSVYRKYHTLTISMEPDDAAHGHLMGSVTLYLTREDILAIRKELNEMLEVESQWKRADKE